MIFLLLRTKLEVEEKEEEQRKLEATRVAEVTGLSCSGKGGQSSLQTQKCKITPFFPDVALPVQLSVLKH